MGFTVVEKLSDLNYLIRRSQANQTVVVHVNRLKKWKSKPEPDELIESVEENESENETKQQLPEQENLERTEEEEKENERIEQVEDESILHEVGEETVSPTDNRNIASGEAEPDIQLPPATQTRKEPYTRRKSRFRQNVAAQPRRPLRNAIKQPTRLITEI